MRFIRRFWKGRNGPLPVSEPASPYRPVPPQQQPESIAHLYLMLKALGIALIVLLLIIARTPKLPSQGTVISKGWTCESVLRRAEDTLLPVQERIPGRDPSVTGFVPVSAMQEVIRLSTSSTEGPVACTPLGRPLQKNEELIEIPSSYVFLRDTNGKAVLRTFPSPDGNARFIEGQKYDLEPTDAPR
jgi:hypothetical protein